jgi:hypothetical protein
MHRGDLRTGAHRDSSGAALYCRLAYEANACGGAARCFWLQPAALAKQEGICKQEDRTGAVNQGQRQRVGVHSCSRLPASQMSAQYWRLHRASSAKDTPSLRLGLLLSSHSCGRSSVQVLRLQHARQVQHSAPAAGPGQRTRWKTGNAPFVCCMPHKQPAAGRPLLQIFIIVPISVLFLLTFLCP